MVTYNCIRHFNHMTACKAFNNKCCSCCAQKKRTNHINARTINTFANKNPSYANHAIALAFDNDKPAKCDLNSTDMPIESQSTALSVLPMDNNNSDLPLMTEDLPLMELQPNNNESTLVLDNTTLLAPPIDNNNDSKTIVSRISTELPAYENNKVSHGLEQAMNELIKTTVKLTDAIAHLFSSVNESNNNNIKPCGLLHFKEWWELVGVNIFVNGEQISGIPISVTEDVMRVINNEHSYFIPLEKVDYIRTNDGLLSDFNPSDNQPI